MASPNLQRKQCKRVMSTQDPGNTVEGAPDISAAAENLAQALVSLANHFLAWNVPYPLDGHNAEKFLKEYEPLFATRFTTPEILYRNLRSAVPRRHMAVSEGWEEFQDSKWDLLKERMIREFGNLEGHSSSLQLAKQRQTATVNAWAKTQILGLSPCCGQIIS
ncbi:BQ2448_6045 [Microbotryum intermedium]|uniref:BQ2448_6045 protein n=1 Tax=Microbotryum intermedium TaxID=269621 RepID=A0A238FKD5_9BASI|nr:BQ2448_6045 [Microbotryum intermedium]